MKPLIINSFTKYFWLVSLVFFCNFVISCSKSKEIDKLKNELAELKRGIGDFQYRALDPQISFNISAEEFKKEDSYNVELKYTINLRQNNTTFPVKKYNVAFSVDIEDNLGNKRDNMQLFGIIENGSLSLSDITTLYAWKWDKTEQELSGFKLKVKTYDWWPISTLKPFLPELT